MASKELMLRVARMSHETLMTNQEIADQLFEEKQLRSRNAKRVQEIVDEAGAWLIQEHERLAALEDAETFERLVAVSLCDKFGLMDARVVGGGEAHGPAEYAALLRRYGRAAADYFDEVSSAAEDNGQQLNVAVSGGQTILDMVTSLVKRRRPNVHYYATALIGRGSQNWTSHIGPETTASLAWARSGRIPRHLFYGTVPPYDFGPEDRQGVSKREKHNWVRSEILRQVAGFAKARPIREILKDTNDRINMAIAGIGIIRPPRTDADYGSAHLERITMTNLLKPLGIDPDLLVEEGVCGEISYCMFDTNGQGNPRWNFFLSAGDGTSHSGVAFYRNLVEQGRKVMVIAGEKKWDALLPAIRARLFNVLITDARTAHRLLES